MLRTKTRKIPIANLVATVFYNGSCVSGINCNVSTIYRMCVRY